MLFFLVPLTLLLAAAASPKLIINSVEVYGDLPREMKRQETFVTLGKTIRLELRDDSLLPVRVIKKMSAALFRGRRTLHFVHLPQKIRIEAGDTLIFYHAESRPESEIKKPGDLLPLTQGAVVLHFIYPVGFLDSFPTKRLEQIQRFSLGVIAGIIGLLFLYFLLVRSSDNLVPPSIAKVPTASPPAPLSWASQPQPTCPNDCYADEQSYLVFSHQEIIGTNRIVSFPVDCWRMRDAKRMEKLILHFLKIYSRRALGDQSYMYIYPDAEFSQAEDIVKADHN